MNPVGQALPAADAQRRLDVFTLRVTPPAASTDEMLPRFLSVVCRLPCQPGVYYAMRFGRDSGAPTTAVCWSGFRRTSEWRR